MIRPRTRKFPTASGASILSNTDGWLGVRAVVLAACVPGGLTMSLMILMVFCATSVAVLPVS
ncbi:hypothetical protein EF879_13500 [Micromonospora sp. HM5-17]|nr:hypothetical protein EF879_13500 [Micromonospora sp. HM5-17]